MAVNAIFKTNNLASIQAERNLYSDLIKEAIQIYGHDVYYVDRTLVARDNVLGEDALSKFVTQHPIEMYVEDATGGYAGEREIITQFGLENRNEITFVVNKKRFQELDSQITLEDGTGTTGGSIQLEAGTIDQTTSSSRLETQITQSFVTLSGTDSSSTDADDKIMLEDDKRLSYYQRKVVVSSILLMTQQPQMQIDHKRVTLSIHQYLLNFLKLVL